MTTRLQSASRISIREESQVHEEVVEALVHMNCDPRLLDRTRRATRIAALAARERQRRLLRNIASIFLVLMTVLFLLSPMIWTGVEALLLGDYFSGFSVEASFDVVLLSSAVVAALLLILKGQLGLRRSRHGS